ncbi:MAG: hypothetical protein VB141_11505, partial [Burkholderia gladioli]
MKRTKFTLEMVLAIMEPGQRYGAQGLATTLGMPVTTVRLLLGSDQALTRVISRGKDSKRTYEIDQRGWLDSGEQKGYRDLVGYDRELF